MKFIALTLAIVFGIQSTCWIPSADAAVATFTTNAAGPPSAQAEVPVNKIGALLLADATAFLNGNNIEVRAKKPDDTIETLLKGTALNTAIVGSGANRRITGIAFFQSGSSFAGLSRKPERPDKIQTASGDICEGAITNVSPDGLNCGSRRVPASQLKCVDSPYAFQFEIPLMSASGVNNISGEANSIEFSSCIVQPAPVVQKAPRETKVKVSSGGGISTRTKVIVGLLLLAGIATAIAVPIAVASSRRGNNNRHRDEEALALLIRQRQLHAQESAVQSQLSSSLVSPFSR